MREKLFDYVVYDETSPSKLRWSCSRLRGDNRPISSCSKGKVCGSVDSKGYWTFRFENKKYRVHNIVYRIFNNFETIPNGYVIDHKDGDQLNNRISNLRKITTAQNTRNLKFKGNSSGIRGVVYFKNNKIERFCAIWVDEFGKEKRKSFSVLKYGFEVAKTKAIEERNKAIVYLNSIGFKYTERHSILV